MRTPLLLACALAGAAAFTTQSLAKTAAPPAPVKVSIADYAFKPATLTVAAGTTVEWTNRDDDPHTVTADDGSFDSHGLGQGDAYRRTFAKPGRYPYHCAAHPFMKGVVTVKGASTP